MSNVKEILDIAINETKELLVDEIFLLKDLFKGYTWRRIPLSERLLLRTLFLNYVITNEINVKVIEKTSSNQQRYKKI